MRLKVVCAWCGRTDELEPASGKSDVGKSEVTDLCPLAPDALVSHTICDRCFVRETAHVERIVRARRQQRSA